MVTVFWAVTQALVSTDEHISSMALAVPQLSRLELSCPCFHRAGEQ